MTDQAEVSQWLQENAVDPDPAPEPTEASEAAVVAEAAEQGLSDDTVIQLKRGDEIIEKTLGQLKLEGMMHEDYSRKTAALAADRRALEAALPEIERMSNEHAQMRAYLAQLEAAQTSTHQQMQVPQGQAPTQAQVQQYAQQQGLTAAQVQQMLARERQAFQAELRQRDLSALAQQNVQVVDKTISDLKREYPSLAMVDDIDFLLRRDASKTNPQTMQDVDLALRSAAAHRAESLSKAFKAQQKQAAVAPTTLEPPGGSPPATPARHYKLGSKELVNAVIDAMQE